MDLQREGDVKNIKKRNNVYLTKNLPELKQN